MDYYTFLGLIITDITVGRKIAIPVGIALGIPPLYVFSLIFLLDLLQIPFFLYGFSKVTGLMKKFRFYPNPNKLDTFSKYGKWGVTILVALPIQGGGIWSGSLLAQLVGMDKKLAVILLTIGSIIGCIGLTLLSVGVIDGIKYLIGFS